jgi:carboxypeptidase PM20D1
MLRTTTALTIVNAGNKDNVIPGQAEATVNFRILPGDTRATVLQHVRGKVGPASSVKVCPAAPTRRRCRRPTRLVPARSTARALAVPRHRRRAGALRRRLRFAALRADRRQHLPFLAGAREARGPARLHGTNERISVANLGELVRFYHQLLRNLNAPAP